MYEKANEQIITLSMAAQFYCTCMYLTHIRHKRVAN